MTNGGGILMAQLENEYGGGAEDKREAIHQMYRMVKQRGIDVPLFSCNTSHGETRRCSTTKKLVPSVGHSSSAMIKEHTVDFAFVKPPGHSLVRQQCVKAIHEVNSRAKVPIASYRTGSLL